MTTTQQTNDDDDVSQSISLTLRKRHNSVSAKANEYTHTQEDTMNETPERSNRLDREYNDDRRPPTGEIRRNVAGRTGTMPTPTGSATSSVTTTTSMKRHSSTNNNNKNYDDDNEEGGYVTSRLTTTTTTPIRGRGRVNVSSSSAATTTPSSWAQDNRGRLRTQQSILHYPDGPSSERQQQQQRSAVVLDGISLPPPPSYTVGGDSNQVPSPHHHDTKSFKGWLTGSLLGALNTAAGITLSATNTIATPAVGMTQNVILPSILALIVETLDNVTPTFVKDWFRILSSSVYHLYSVLASTNQGKVLRRQLLLVIQNVLEAWSAPESRQVVVDGMAAGVKLADALQ
jgi:hypothetical protein